MPDGLFLFFAALTLGAACMLVASRNAVTSAMGMILALVGVAADFFLLDAYFLGVLQVLVYAGAVMVLFLFIIMLLNTDDPEGAYPWKAAALGLAVFFLLGAGVLWLFHWSGAVASTPAGATHPSFPTYLKCSPLRLNLSVACSTPSTSFLWRSLASSCSSRSSASSR